MVVDNLTAAQRKKNMANIRSRHTKPELVVRSLVHRLGYRFILHARNLPGRPDIVLPRHKKIILVNGCFWHMHRCPRGSVVPKTNFEYWSNKRKRTVERDRTNIKAYRKLGWNTLVIWECELKAQGLLLHRLAKFLGNTYS